MLDNEDHQEKKKKKNNIEIEEPKNKLLISEQFKIILE